MSRDRDLVEFVAVDGSTQSAPVGASLMSLRRTPDQRVGLTLDGGRTWLAAYPDTAAAHQAVDLIRVMIRRRIRRIDLSKLPVTASERVSRFVKTHKTIAKGPR